MAILAVKIDNLATLRMNEFFDYAGHCWALSRSRSREDAVGAELEDFYEGTVRSGHMEGIPVIFIYENQVVGWYETAIVYRYIRHPALFLEGNICADTRNVRLLKQPVSDQAYISQDVRMGVDFPQDKNYLVIENGDMRYSPLKTLIHENPGPFETVDYAKAAADGRAQLFGQAGRTGVSKKAVGSKRSSRIEGLLKGCEIFASEIMEDRCRDIGTVKALGELALEVTRQAAGNVNGWYYLAMANYQLGFVRKGLKAVDRAIRLEPDGDDLLVMKGNLLVSNSCFEEALHCYEEAYAINPEDSYYIMAGRACACMGNPVAAEGYYRKVKDPEILKDFEIKLNKKKFI